MKTKQGMRSSVHYTVKTLLCREVVALKSKKLLERNYV